MPGYYVHLAACDKKARDDRSFVLGVEIPDLLKTYYKLYGINGTREKYNKLKTPIMPDFSRLSERVQQEETDNGCNGMHFGWSSNPDYMCFLSTLKEEEKQNPFFRGYLWHLLTDLLIYSFLNIEKRFNDFAKNHQNDDNLQELLNNEYKKLHNDWDKINTIIRYTYPDVMLTPEVIELNIIQYIQNENTTYVDLNIIIYLLNYLRMFNPINQPIDYLIEQIKELLTKKNYVKTKNILT